MDNHTLTVAIPFGKLGDIFDWCKQNCTGDWHFANLEVGGDDVGNYTISFSKESDCNFFAMRWL